MKTPVRLLAFFLLLWGSMLHLQAQSVIYSNASASADLAPVRTMGYTDVIVSLMSINPNGDIVFGPYTVCSGGNYTMGNYLPNYASDMAALKTPGSSVRRIDIGIGGWGNGSFDNVRNLIAAQGTGTGSILYRNLSALKNAIPAIDAISSDDEQTYDANSAIQFGVMLADIGYKFTLAPYMNKPHWETVANSINAQRPGTVDRIYLQCYAGGANNNPCNWHIGNIPLYAGLWTYDSQSTVETRMTDWKNQCGVTGGFMWIEGDPDRASYATVINRVFGVTTPPSTGVVTTFKDINFTGFSGGFSIGDYNLNALRALGVADNSITSVQVAEGYKVILYFDDNFTGQSMEITSNTAYVGGSFNDQVTSLRVRANGAANMAGTYFLQNRNSNLYMDVWVISTADGAAVLQGTYNGGANQQFRFEHLGDGVYKIVAVHSGKVLNIDGASTANGARLQQWAYLGFLNQQFIVVPASDGYAKLIARHSGKVIEVSNGSMANGADIQQWDNNSQTGGQWKLLSVTNPQPSTLIQAENYTSMSGIQTEATTDTGGGLNVGWADTGDWMVYSNINFPTTGLYLIEYRVASAMNGARISADLNAGSIVLGALDVPNTGGWQNWTTISHTVNVTAGTYNFGVFIQSTGVNLNWIQITKAGSALSLVSSETSGEVIPGLYPNPVERTLFFTSDMDISGTSVRIFSPTEISPSEQRLVTDNSLDVSGLGSGVYMVEFYKGGKRVVKRFVKK